MRDERIRLGVCSRIVVPRRRASPGTRGQMADSLKRVPGGTGARHNSSARGDELVLWGATSGLEPMPMGEWRGSRVHHGLN
jgi:hypothetical protein